MASDLRSDLHHSPLTCTLPTRKPHVLRDVQVSRSCRLHFRAFSGPAVLVCRSDPLCPSLLERGLVGAQRTNQHQALEGP